MKNYEGYDDYRGWWKTGPTDDEISKAVAHFQSRRSFLQEVTGSISNTSHQKWHPRTQWKSGGRGLVQVTSIGTRVIDVDAGDKLIGFTTGKLLHLDGKEVQVFGRSTPLYYNGYYAYEVIWLSEGESLPPEYPPVFHERGAADVLFGTQADQASCVPASSAA